MGQLSAWDNPCVGTFPCLPKAQVILPKHHIACACGEFLVQLYRFPVFCVSVSRAMVRKGWSTLEVPDCWLKVVNVISLFDQHPRRNHKPCHHNQSTVRVFHLNNCELPQGRSKHPSQRFSPKTPRDGSAPASFDKSPASKGGVSDRSANSSHRFFRQAGSETFPETRREHRKSQEGVGGSGACERNRCPRPRGRRKSVAEVEEAGNRSSSPRTSSSFRGCWTATACSAVADRTRRIRQNSARASSGESNEEKTCFARGFCPADGRGTRTVDVCQTVGDARRHCRRAHFGSVQVRCIGGKGCKDIGKLDTQSFQRKQHGPLIWAPRLTLHQCGFSGVRVGEASNPGHQKASKISDIVPGVGTGKKSATSGVFG